MSPKHIYLDMGKNRFDDYRAEKTNRKEQASSFLKGFYRGHKSPEIWSKYNQKNTYSLKKTIHINEHFKKETHHEK